MAEIDYSWPPSERRQKIGKRTSRLDGPAKSTGRATYAYDVQRPGMLFAVIATCPHAHARIRSIDTSAAEKAPGFASLELMAKPGEEIQYAGYEIVAIAADTEERARDAARLVKVDYEVLPHLVHEHDLAKAGPAAVPSAEQTTGDPETALKQAEAVSEGFYAIPVLTHCCMEAHGQVMEWKGDQINYFPSTQNVSGLAGEIAKAVEVPVTTIHTQMDVMGGGFGSKFGSDRWGPVGALLSRKAGGRPVKLFLDRRTELEIAGNRPSFYARIKVGGRKDGTITLWQTESWATGGPGGQNLPAGQFPYVFKRVPNVSMKHTSVRINAAPQRAWRAPNHPQLSYLTCTAMEDFAARIGMDPLEVFIKNAEYAQVKEHIETYRAQLRKAAELAEWKKLWHPRGQGAGHLRRGLGIGVNMWGGLGHPSRCETTIHPDGSVEVKIGSQDLGTGTRTIITMVAAESLGLPLSAVKAQIGSNRYPPSGASGGSTTVGGVSASTRKSTMNALARLYEKVAPALGATPDQLEAVDGRIQVKGTPSKSLEWKAACAKLGTQAIVEMGENAQRGPGGLINQGAAGVQIADVSVDIETGIVRMNRLTAVQDCGLIINPKTAESQVQGACIMSICGALYEERIMDQPTGRMLNADMEFYKLASAGDIGEIVVHMNLEPEHDKRGVIGLGEPPVIGGIAAISNAVANAVGVRVPMVPLTPDRVLKALEGRNA